MPVARSAHRIAHRSSAPPVPLMSTAPFVDSHIRARRLDDDRRLGRLVEREIDVAAVAGVKLAADDVAVEPHARPERRWEG